MERLWSSQRPITAREMMGLLKPDRSLAYTTVMTTLDRLTTKGLLVRRLEGRAHVYEPTGTRAQWAGENMADVLDEVQDRSEALLHFVGHISPSELDSLRQALRKAGRRRT